MSDQKQSRNSAENARSCAARAIVSVMQEGQLLEAALDQAPGYLELSARDRAFARLLVSTVFRRLGQVEAVLKPRLTRRPSSYVMAALYLGVVQILVLKTPVHAAIGETVEIVKQRRKHKGYAPMVNAVLRRISEEGAKAFAMTPPMENIPKWIRTAWTKAYGASETRRMAAALMATPPLDLTVKGDVQAWAERLGGEAILRQTLRLSSAGQVREIDGFDNGDWWVQDVSSAIPVYLLGDVKGQKALDMCAAPGGKTLQLAAGGAEVTAVDKSAHRLARLEENLKRTGLSARVETADALDWGEPEPVYDIVVLDAPCTATGTYRRHPDVLYHKSPKDLAQLVKLQDKLLDRAAQWVRPGGHLVYCTCSLQPEEGELRADAFLKRQTGFELSAPGWDALKGGGNFASDAKYVRLLPGLMGDKGGMDGFFTAKFHCLNR